MISTNAQNIINKRYLQEGETSWADIAGRIGKAVGSDDVSQMINDMLFIPGGRILRNVGRERGSLFNCYNLPIGDSREEIGDCIKNCLILWGEGGGCGVNFSTLRPKGTAIKGVGGTSSGLVSFMRALDGVAATVESGGQRRAASLGLCEVWHPEILRFANCKTKEGDISYFNISVGITERFIQAVQERKPWELHFNKQVYETVPSETLWECFISNMLKNGEPGFINMDNLRTNNSWYFAPITGCNPCGEATLDSYGVCNLGSLVLPNFVSNGRVGWAALGRAIERLVFLLDTCIDLNKYTLQEVKRTAQRSRRVGVGTMGYADMLFKLGLRYGSIDAIDFTERLFKFIRNAAYTASIKLSCDKGSFPAFESNQYCQSKFVRTLSPSMRKDIRKYGTRNVTLLAMAPTGTISLIPETTSGIEPLFSKAYKRTDRISNRIYIHQKYKEILESGGETPDWLVDTSDLQPEDHINTQVAIQRYVDGAVSKTLNVPEDFSSDELSELLLESILDIKGMTLYKEGSRKEQILTPLNEEEARTHINEATSEQDDTAVDCDGGSCGI